MRRKLCEREKLTTCESLFESESFFVLAWESFARGKFTVTENFDGKNKFSGKYSDAKKVCDRNNFSVGKLAVGNNLGGENFHDKQLGTTKKFASRNNLVEVKVSVSGKFDDENNFGVEKL